MSSGTWRTEGVRVVRAAAIGARMGAAAGAGRATACEFTGSGGRETWIGKVALAPGGQTGAHHHGRHEVAVYVVRGRGLIRWGERLEWGAEIGPGDFVYFAPFVPHQEINLDAGASLDFVVVRSDGERIALDLDIAPVAAPEMIV